MTVATDPAFGERLRELRERAGFSQSRLADRLKVTRQFISALESNKTDASWPTVRRLARALGVSVAEFDVGELEKSLTDPAPSPQARGKYK